MKKIAILTQPLISNYGGILQAFALQKVLKNKNYDVTTIDRRYNGVSSSKLFLSNVKNTIINKLKLGNERNFTSSDINYITKNPRNFISKYITLSEIIDQNAKMVKHFENKSYDVVIVGSDQVWRPRYSPNIYDYFFGFLKDSSKTKKLSYAASFGVDTWEYNENQTKEVKNLISLFDAVSVREKSAVELCKNNLDAQAQFVLDPTLLLEKEDYLKLITKKSEKSSASLFTYVLDKSESKKDIINFVQKKLGKEIKTNQPKEMIKESSSRVLSDYAYPPIEGWIESFDEADFIVTDSFHGTVFSLIFNKPFLTIVNSDRGAARFKSLLSLLDLEDRLIDAYDESLISEKLSLPIDYIKVNERLKELKADSLAYLFNNIEK